MFIFPPGTHWFATVNTNIYLHQRCLIMCLKTSLRTTFRNTQKFESCAYNSRSTHSQEPRSKSYLFCDHCALLKMHWTVVPFIPMKRHCWISRLQIKCTTKQEILLINHFPWLAGLALSCGCTIQTCLVQSGFQLPSAHLEDPSFFWQVCSSDTVTGRTSLLFLKCVGWTAAAC